MRVPKSSKLSFSSWLAIVSIRGYQAMRPMLDQVILSVFGTVSQCKHTPTCSEYTIQSIRRHGTIAGVVKGMNRILSCR